MIDNNLIDGKPAEKFQLNDLTGQVFYKTKFRFDNLTFDERLRKKEELKEKMRQCKHLFVRLPGECIECVKCGVTNKYIETENILYRYTIIDDASTESQMYYELLEHSRKSLNLLSQEIIDTLHPDLLYNLALQINPKASRKTIFEIMKQLHELETSQEKIRFSNRTENVARKLLLSRYY